MSTVKFHLPEKKIMQNSQIEDIARLLKSIAHPIRLKILCLLQDEELSVGDILLTIQTTNGNISQHLAILRNQGIIVSRKDANYIYNRIADPRVLELMESMQELFCCPAGKGRRARAEDGDPAILETNGQAAFETGMENSLP